MFRVHLVLCPGAGVARQARERRRFRSLCSLPHVRFHARTSTLPAGARAHHRRPSPAYGVGGVPTSADFGRMGPVPTLPRLVLVRLPSNNASTHTHTNARERLIFHRPAFLSLSTPPYPSRPLPSPYPSKPPHVALHYRPASPYPPFSSSPVIKQQTRGYLSGNQGTLGMNPV